MEPNLSVDFFGKIAASPLVLASGVMGISYSGMLKVVENGCGIITTKSYTVQRRKGHEGPVVAEFNGGFINSMGLSNPGIYEGMKEIADCKKRCDAPIIISLFGVTAAEFTELVRAVDSSIIDAIELNLSCPNVADEYGIPIAASTEKVFEIVSAVKSITKLPVIAKLSPNTYNVPEIALSAEKAGADALTLINTLGPGMIIDINAQKPVILNKFGGISGAAIKPLAVKLIYEISKLVKIPIIGTGGVLTGEDAVEFLLAGAAYVGVGTAVYYNGIDVFAKINAFFSSYLRQNNLASVRDIKPI
ncbi:MAG: dihydroorotate dehydrogenase [Ignavibacteriales bacterium]|nr:dihydroorotate dehydrogenase [Ignavibacteriales bacterium]